MRILLLGDTHADKGAVKYAHEVAKGEGIDRIVQVGDFGYWPGEHGHDTFTEYVSHKAVEAGVTWYWLDGNHENFDALEQTVDMTAPGPTGISSGYVMSDVLPHVFYLPRGCTWVWDGVRFMALGGAYSVDEDSRVPHVSWWPQETLTEADVARAVSRGVVDVLLTHDAPEGACPIIGSGSAQQAGWGYKADAKSKANRVALSAVIESAKPKLVVHGHMHHRYDVMMHPYSDHPYDVAGLGRDGQRRDSWVIFDTVTRQLEQNRPR